MQITTSSTNEHPYLTSTNRSDKKASDSKENKVESWSESVKKMGFAKATMQYIAKHPIQTAVAIGAIAAVVFGVYYNLQEKTITCPTIILGKQSLKKTNYADSDYTWIGESKIVQSSKGIYQRIGTAYPRNRADALIIPEEHKGWLYCPLTRTQAEGIAKRYIDTVNSEPESNDRFKISNIYEQLEKAPSQEQKDQIQTDIRTFFSQDLPDLQKKEGTEIHISRFGWIDSSWFKKAAPQSSVDCHPGYADPTKHSMWC